MHFADLYLAAILDDNLPESFTLSPEQAFRVEDMVMYMLEQRAAERGTLIVNTESLH
jgi:hypothetical protein